MLEVRLSIVLVNWNSRDDLRDCLESLRAQKTTEWECIVIDNGSKDGSVEMLRTESSWITVLPQDDNLGFAAACNIGIAMSRGEWVVMLNNDTVAGAGFVEALARAAGEAPSDCGMLQCLMAFMDRPNVTNSTGIALVRDGTGVDRGEGEDAGLWRNREEIFCPTAGAAAYRRSMLEQTRLKRGYFDAGHFLYFEDLDLGWRARLAGWSAHLVSDALVMHRYHGSSRRLDPQWLDVLTKTNHTRTVLKNASLHFLARSSPALLMSWYRIWREGGFGAVSKLSAAVADAWTSRREVEGMERVGRRALERAWVGRLR